MRNQARTSKHCTLWTTLRATRIRKNKIVFATDSHKFTGRARKGRLLCHHRVVSSVIWDKRGLELFQTRRQKDETSTGIARNTLGKLEGRSMLLGKNLLDKLLGRDQSIRTIVADHNHFIKLSTRGSDSTATIDLHNLSIYTKAIFLYSLPVCL